MQQRTFEEVRESLRGKVILVANRGIPARRISRSIRERFEAIAAITATDIDKTEPAAASAQELILLGADPRAYLDLPRIIRLARIVFCEEAVINLSMVSRKFSISFNVFSYVAVSIPMISISNDIKRVETSL